jgi:long-chain acyl-CoA synthetase
MDLGADRRVAVYAENSAETAIAHIAAILAGASAVPVNFHLRAEEAAYIIADADCRVVLTGPENAERAVAAAGLGVPVVAWRTPDAPPSVRSWTDLLAAAPATEPPTDSRPLPNLLYTSGTTGRPKGTELPPDMFAAGADVAEYVRNLKQNPLAVIGPHLVVAPMYHTGPLSGVRALAAGTSLVVMDGFDAEGVLANVQRYRAAASVMVPTHFGRLLALPADVRARYDTSSLLLVAHTGSMCPPDVKRAMIDWLGPVIVESYGATEAGVLTTIDSHDWLTHPGSVGRPNPRFEAVVVDDDGSPVPPGTEGRLYFRDLLGRGIVYHHAPEKSAAAHLEPGVLTAGEVGYVDGDGYVYITDRVSDMVVTGGVNVYPAEAEMVLRAHPRVSDAACVGVPNADLGEELRALVVPADGELTAGELLEFCAARLTRYKCPRGVDFVAALPRNALGKLNKRDLRAPYWADR